MLMKSVEIAGKMVGPGNPCFVIAETGVNHNGDLGMAIELVDAAADSGADAVKFQSLNADLLVSPTAPKADYQIKTVGGAETQAEMIRALELDLESHIKIMEHAEKRGIIFISTPFDPDSADMLEGLGVPVFKTGSGEVNNWPHLRHIAAKGKPVIFSTGMSYLGEVEAAIRVMNEVGNDSLVILHCVSQYPAPVDQTNLKAMQTMMAVFDYPVGHSDHSLGYIVPVAAVALGASMIEKHMTLDKKLPGPDHLASAEPDEIKYMVEAIREVESALGDGVKAPQVAEEETRRIIRRSIAVRHDIPEGAVISMKYLKMIRPGEYITPELIDHVVGRVARRQIKAGEFISWADLA